MFILVEDTDGGMLYIRISEIICVQASGFYRESTIVCKHDTYKIKDYFDEVVSLIKQATKGQ